MIHNISEIINHNFHAHQTFTSCDYGKEPGMKIKVFSSSTKNNYGKVLEKLGFFLPEIYENVNSEELAIISNSNRKDIMGWYIDMEHLFTLKENLPGLSDYAITDKDVKYAKTWISKPSHPHIGSGKYIMIGAKKNLIKRPTILYRKEPLKWVLQPLLTNVLLWHEKYKFDIRTYCIMYNVKDKFYGACYKIGIVRRSVNIHNPIKDPNSAITNISVQHSIFGYDSEFHMPMIYDDKRISHDILKDLISKCKPQRDIRKKTQFLILGMDIIFLEDGTPKLIEVNEGPHIEVDQCITNNEKMASEGFILGAFGYILPNLLKGNNIRRLKDWDFCC